MANSRYNRWDNQAPAQTQLKADSVSVGRSAHDFSHTVVGNAMFGMVAPVVTFDVVPNEDIDISLSALLEFRNPTVRQLYNGARVYFHAYYNRLTDLWEGAKNWLDNGRSGKIQLSRPNLFYHNEGYNANTPMSLLNFFGLPAEVMQQKVNISSAGTTRTVPFPPLRAFQTADQSSSNSIKLADSVDYFPADCCMAYQRNWRDYYCNKNLLQNNKYWFPDNEDHFILSYDCEQACAVLYENEMLVYASGGNARDDNLCAYRYHVDDDTNPNTTWQFITPEPNNPATSASDDIVDPKYAPNLAGIKFRQFRGDRFTTSLPFPDLIRGDIPSLDLNLQDLSAVFKGTTETIYADKIHNPSGSALPGTPGDYDMYGYEATYPNGQSGIFLGYYPHTTTTGDATDFVSVPVTITPKGTVEINGTSSSLITMSDIYTMETLTAFRRRMGMTNGDYNEMIKAQYGSNPHTPSHQGTYIGGFYQDFAMSSVTQTSQSTSGEDGSPLGQKAGQGVSSGSGNIGHFHTPDFGWIQIYMCVVPDVYYTQGKPRMFSKKSNLEMYFPLFNNLPAQAILNKELYVSGTSANDNDVFAYEDRYAEYKSAPNRVTGFIGLSPEVAAFDASRIIARRFSSTPALNSKFVTMVPENIDMSVFTVDDEPPFDFSVGASIRRVFPGPYTAIEGSLSSPALVRG